MNNIQFRDFIDMPYRHGWEHAKKALGPQPNIIRNPCFCNLEENPRPSLCGRIGHLALTVLLWFPVVNIITHIALKCLFPPTPPANRSIASSGSDSGSDNGPKGHPGVTEKPKETPGSDNKPKGTPEGSNPAATNPAPMSDSKPAAGKPDPVTDSKPSAQEEKTKDAAKDAPGKLDENKSDFRPGPFEKQCNVVDGKIAPSSPNVRARLQELLAEFVEKIKKLENPSEISQESHNLEMNPFYQQLLHNLQQIDRNAVYANLICILKMMIDSNTGLSDRAKDYVIYRMVNEYSIDKMQEFLKSKSEKWGVLRAPGDGNCFLWSCIMSERIRKAEKPANVFESLQSLASSRSSHPEFAGLDREMMDLRNQMADMFIHMINHPDSKIHNEFRRRFFEYVERNQTVRDAVVSADDDLDILTQINEPSPGMIKKYQEFLRTRDTWNGEFEAEIASTVLHRPIVILNGTSDQRLSLRTAAGLRYFEEMNVNPIVVRFNGSDTDPTKGDHYDCLL